MATIDISSVFPGWEIVRTIGKGSFGTVYEIHRDRFGKTEKAALKVMRIPNDYSVVDELRDEGYDDASIRKRIKSEFDAFTSEYDNMRKLTHTNIVSCDDLEYRETKDGFDYTLYMKMELLTPIMKVVISDVNAEKLAIDLAKDICSALVLCKSRNIVHRDIKPQNLFVNDYGEYKLGDFGVAREMDHATNATRTGTYKYMAPEVFNGEVYGHNVDIYSLGLVMYWILNEKRLPFYPLPPKTPTAQQEEEARWRRIRGEKIPDPKNGSPELKKIVLKACEADRSKRYQSAAEMLADLEAVGSATSAAAKPEQQNGVAADSWDDDDSTDGYAHSGISGDEYRLDSSGDYEESDESTRGNSWNDDEESVADPLSYKPGNAQNITDDIDKTENKLAKTVNKTEAHKPDDEKDKNAPQPDSSGFNFSKYDPPFEPVVKKSFFNNEKIKEWIISTFIFVLGVTLVLVITEFVNFVRDTDGNYHIWSALNYEYIITDNGNATIRNYTGSDSNVEIPSELGGHPVTTIGEKAFYEYDSLASVTIPDSVTSFGNAAFSSCSDLTSITIPDSITKIDSSAFSYCSSLTSVTIPDSVTTIGSYAFYECSSLTSVTIPDYVESIGIRAFSSCNKLTSVTIPDSVTKIYDYAFDGCDDLTIYGKAGSEAESYAERNDIPFSEI